MSRPRTQGNESCRRSEAAGAGVALLLAHSRTAGMREGSHVFQKADK